MKAKLCLLTALFSLVTCAFGASQVAAVRMYCLSIEVGHGVNLPYSDTVDFNYLGTPESAGEFIPWWPNGSGLYYDITLPDIENHASTMSIYDGTYEYTCSGTLRVDLPMTDANNNRFPDFFELARSANYTTTGSYDFYDWVYGYYDSGQITSAIWTRSAGSRTGNYAFTFYDYTTQSPDYWGTFRGTFKMLEYTGTLSYTPGSNVVTGTINLVQTGVPANTWQGAVQFTKVAADRFNSMTNQPGFWVNSSSQIYNFTNHYFFRDPNYPTNYAGYIEFDNDADLASLYPYATWVLSITDTNDLNHNGIPDFSDDPSTLPPPRRPLISLTRTTTNLLFTIHGDINHLHEIQQVPVIRSTNWQHVVSVTLTNDPQVVPVAFPTGSTFYRARAQ